MTTTAPQLELRHVEPAALDPNPANVRKDLGDLAPLVESISEQGVIQPLLVHEVDGKLRIIAGHRRQAAAVKAKAKTVPVVVVPAGTDAGQLEQMLTENLQREDLSAGEEAAAFEQLAALGVDVGRIAKVSGRKKDVVQKHLDLAASKVATGVATKYDLTLEQGLVLAEFDGDKEAVKKLTVTAQKEPGQFGHVAERLRQDRKNAEQIAAAEAEIAKLGVQRATDREVPGWQKKSAWLDDLASSARNVRLDEKLDEHKDCPGHRVAIQKSYYDPPKLRYLCTDPKKYGHKKYRHHYDDHGRPAPEPTEAEKAKATQERREQLEANRAWKAATPVRQKFVTDLLARKTVPKGTLAFVAGFLVKHPGSYNHHDDKYMSLLLTGQESTSSQSWNLTGVADLVKFEAKLPEPRKPMALLAIVAAEMEQSLAEQGHKSPNAEKEAWYQFLESAGYTMAPVELLACPKRKAQGAKAMTKAVAERLAAKKPAAKKTAKKAPAKAAKAPAKPAARGAKKAAAK